MSTLPLLDLTLPYITDGLPGIEGRIRAKPEDFMVEEVPLYDPSGVGSHLFLNLTKRNLTTRDVQVQLADLFELRPENIGTAGLKDKFAVTTQSFSVLFEKPGTQPKDVIELIEDNIEVKVNWAKFHKNKLRAGHLIGNKFKITITGIDLPQDTAVERSLNIADRIHAKGLPNYYGEQRTGRLGKNVLAGWEILHGQKRLKNRWLRKYLVSGYQSYLSNRYLAERVRRGLFERLLNGDIAKKHDTGGLFWVDDSDAEQPRYIAQEISFTTPMYGYKMSKPTDEAAQLEDEIFKESNLTMDLLRKQRVTGTRRLGRLIPRIKVDKTQDGVQLSFMLRKGGFATILLREFMKTRLKDLEY
ncbi:MAG: tRNA pseudouridine(13) synthase TruD [Candidatus Bathyarchaeota archaeon]|nr:tRNA pseudouridine(13) synthase TruD [Candidatus Bathyarchaeota archaeon]